jgi:hypothetical protein
MQESNKNSQSQPNQTLSKNTNSESMHNPVHKSANCPELEQIITAWPELSAEQKQTILDIINKRQ